MISKVLSLCLLIFISCATVQDVTWKHVMSTSDEDVDSVSYFRLQTDQLYADLIKNYTGTFTVVLPSGYGMTDTFEITGNQVLPENLADKYGIYTFEGFQKNNPVRRIRLEYRSFITIMYNQSGETQFLVPADTINQIYGYYDKKYAKTPDPSWSRDY